MSKPGAGPEADPAARGPMLSVDDARRAILDLCAPLGPESVSLADAAGRVLAAAATALRTQPPFDAAAMDGWAVRASDALLGARLAPVDEAAAGSRADRPLGAKEAIRIFTGAPMPEGADALVIQEDAEFEADGCVRINEAAVTGAHIRRSGIDFRTGETLLAGARRLSPEDIALAAAAGRPWLTVSRRPRLALLSLGDELKQPGEPLGPDDIVASNAYGVAALARAAGADVILSPPVPDDLAALRAAIRDAASADLIVTLGGASDGDHDLARPAFAAEGGSLGFYKIAMRPGKPLASGVLGRAVTLGLPGNPVSAMVCARLFLIPAIERLQGLPGAAPMTGPIALASALEANGPREHYMRASLEGPPGDRRIRPVDSQDSSLLSRLSGADALIVRPPFADAADAGTDVQVLRLRADICV